MVNIMRVLMFCSEHWDDTAGYKVVKDKYGSKWMVFYSGKHELEYHFSYCLLTCKADFTQVLINRIEKHDSTVFSKFFWFEKC